MESGQIDWSAKFDEYFGGPEDMIQPRIQPKVIKIIRIFAKIFVEIYLFSFQHKEEPEARSQEPKLFSEVVGTGKISDGSGTISDQVP